LHFFFFFLQSGAAAESTATTTVLVPPVIGRECLLKDFTLRHQPRRTSLMEGFRESDKTDTGEAARQQIKLSSHEGWRPLGWFLLKQNNDGDGTSTSA